MAFIRLYDLGLCGLCFLVWIMGFAVMRLVVLTKGCVIMHLWCYGVCDYAGNDLG